MQILPNSSESVTTAELALLAALAARYPAFAKVRPLAIGIHAEILADWPEVDPDTLKAALKRYARSFQYRKALERKGSHRLHLDGSDAGEVDEQHRQPLYPRKKPKPPPQSQADPSPPPTIAPPEPVEAPPAAPASTAIARPTLKLKPKAGTVTAVAVTRKEAKP